MTYAIFDKKRRRYVRYGDVEEFTVSKKQLIVFENQKQAERFIFKYFTDYLRLRYIPKELR